MLIIKYMKKKKIQANSLKVRKLPIWPECHGRGLAWVQYGLDMEQKGFGMGTVWVRYRNDMGMVHGVQVVLYWYGKAQY